MRASIRPYNEPEHNRALILSFARFFGIVGIGPIDQPWSGNAASHSIDTSADPPAQSRTHTRPASRAHASSAATADTTAGSCSTRRRSQNRGEWITERPRLRQADIRRYYHRRLRRQLRILVANDHRWRRDLLEGEFRQRPLGRWQLVTIPAAPASACLGRRGRQNIGTDRRADIGNDTDHL